MRVVAIGSAAELAPGSRADVIATQDSQRGTDAARVVLRGATVVDAAPAGESSEGGGLPHVVSALRVTLAEALALARAQAGARELQLLGARRPPTVAERRIACRARSRRQVGSASRRDGRAGVSRSALGGR